MATKVLTRALRPQQRSLHRASLIAISTYVAVVLTVAGLSQLPAWKQMFPRWENIATEAQVRATADDFGISYLQPTRRDGTYWTSQWEAGRGFDGVDPHDDWFDADHGSGSYEAGGGELVISGETPRMYIHEPSLDRQWSDVEVTMYVKRGTDSDIAYSGFTAVARSNHLATEDGSADICDTRGYGARLRFDGHADFEKETAHPRNEAVGNVEVFPGGMPAGVWLGVKYLVFDRADGVHLQMWLDQSDGHRGGDWKKINEVVDDGELFGEVPCASGIDPTMALTGSESREGSESGTPNASVFFRSDGIGRDGLTYKWGSVREISPESDH